MEAGYLVVLKKEKSGPRYEFDEGDHTIGSSKDSCIRLKKINSLLLGTHAIIRVNKDGVATIINKSVDAPIKINGKDALKPAILRHRDTLLVIEKEFLYINEKLKDVPEDGEIFAKERRNLLACTANSRKSVMPLSKTSAKLPTYNTKAKITKTPTQQVLNKSLMLNRSLSTPFEKSLSKACLRRSALAGEYKTTPALKVTSSSEWQDNVAKGTENNLNLTDSEKSFMLSRHNNPDGLENSLNTSSVSTRRCSSRSTSTLQILHSPVADVSSKHAPKSLKTNNSLEDAASSSFTLHLSASSSNDIDNKFDFQCSDYSNSNLTSEGEIPDSECCDDDAIRDLPSEEDSLNKILTPLPIKFSFLDDKNAKAAERSSRLSESASKNETQRDKTGTERKSTLNISRRSSLSHLGSTSDDADPEEALSISNSATICKEASQDFNTLQNGSRDRKTTFEESTREVLPNMSKDKSSVLDVTEEVFSPVQPLSRHTQDNSSGNESRSGRRSITRRSLREQTSESSSLTTTTVEQSTGSVISISSQSFSSFKRASSDVDREKDETEIDVVNITSSASTSEIRRSARFNRVVEKTPDVEEQFIKRSSTTVQMFEDVSCTSTPFHKSYLGKKSQDCEDSNKVRNSERIASKTPTTKFSQSEILVISNTNVTLKSPKLQRSRSVSAQFEARKLVPTRRSSRRSVSRNEEDGCVSCKYSSGHRSRSFSLSNDGSVTTARSSEEAFSIKKKSTSVTGDTETPLLRRKSHVSTTSFNTPEKSVNADDETPKSHVKPTRRSSKANQSVYKPILEDVTPVTPEKLQVSGFTEEAFKTPINTPGLFENIRNSAIRSRKRHRESNGSALKDSKKARVDFSQKEEANRTQEIGNTTVSKKRQQKSPINRLSDFQGVKRLLKTPPKPPNNDLRNIPNLRRIMSPKQQKSPKNDLSNPYGVKKLLKSPNKQKLPVNDLTDVSGVADMFNVSGVDVLHQGSDIENSEDLFTRLTGKRPVRSYPRGKTLSPNKSDSSDDQVGATRKTMGDLPVSSPRVQEWVDKHDRYIVEYGQPTLNDENSFANMSEKPKITSRIVRSMSPKKALFDQESRRNTVGPTLRGQRPCVEKSPDLSEDVPKNVYEDELENMPDAPRKMLRRGRSITPRKAAQTNVNRRKTFGDALIPTIEMMYQNNSKNESPNHSEISFTNKLDKLKPALNDERVKTRKSSISSPMKQTPKENKSLIKIATRTSARKTPAQHSDSNNVTVQIDTPIMEYTQKPMEKSNRDAERKIIFSVDGNDATEDVSSPVTRSSNKKLETLSDIVPDVNDVQKRTRSRRGKSQPETPVSGVIKHDSDEVVAKRTRKGRQQKTDGDEKIKKSVITKGRNNLEKRGVDKNENLAIIKIDSPRDYNAEKPESSKGAGNTKRTRKGRQQKIDGVEIKKPVKTKGRNDLEQEEVGKIENLAIIKVDSSREYDTKTPEISKVTANVRTTRTRRGRNKIDEIVLPKQSETPEVLTEAEYTGARTRKGKKPVKEEGSSPITRGKQPTKKTRSRKAQNVICEDVEEKFVDDKSQTKVEVEHTPDNEDVEFNKPVRGRRKKPNSDLDTAITSPVVKRTRSKTKKQLERETKKPVNKLVEDVIDVAIDSPRTLRARQANKKYSADEYEVAGTMVRSNKRVRFEGDAIQSPEVASKRTRRAKK